MGRHVICRAEALQPSSVLIVEAEKRSIGIFNIHGDFYALRNTCPHKGAPLCRGIITGLTVSDAPLHIHMTREGEIVRCPWHGWEFDIITGRSVYNPHRMRVKTYDVAVEQMSEDDPSVETYPVHVEEEFVVLYI